MNPILLAVLFSLGWVPVFLLRAESRRDALPYYFGAERFWVRVTPMIISLHVTLACMLISFGHPPSNARCAIGVALFAAALAFWLRARAQIGPFDERPLPDDPPRSLRRDGPFAAPAPGLPGAAAARRSSPSPFCSSRGSRSWRSPCAPLRKAPPRVQLGDAYDEYCRSVKRLLPFVW